MIRYVSFIINLFKKLRIIFTFIKRNHRVFPAYDGKKTFKRIENEIIYSLLREKANFIEFERENIYWRGSLKDIGITKKIFSKGEYEGKSVDFISSFIKNNDLDNGIILDIGANIGVPSIPLALKLIHAKIISFEPVVETYKLLEQNISLNNLKHRIECYNIGLGAVNSVYFINYLSNSPATSEIILDNQKSLNINEKVAIKTLSSFIKNNNIKQDSIKFGWIDIQGFESELIKGGEDILKEINVFIEVWPFGLERNKGKDVYIEFLTKNYKFFIPDSNFKEEYDAVLKQEINKFSRFYDSLMQGNTWASVLFIKN